MSGVMEAGMDGDQRAERAAGGKRDVRWSARRKEEIVLRLLRWRGRPASQPVGSPPGARTSSPPAVTA
jgi:hypothetical protein